MSRTEKMNLNRFNSKLWIALFALGLFGFAKAEEAEQALATEFPPQSITTVARANAALKQVPAVRADIADRTLRAKADCYDRFFTSSCLNEVRDRERKAYKLVRRVEVEANAMLRKEKAAERDRAVAEREQRAAEQRAIAITGATRESDAAQSNPDADDARR